MGIRGTGTKGIVKSASFDVIHGDGGTGKSTLANGYPDPVYFDINDGTDNIDVAERQNSTQVPTLTALKAKMSDLLKVNEGFQSVIIDSLTDLDKYIIRHICSDKYESIGDIPHGKGWAQITSETESFLDLCKRLKNEKKMNVVLIAHSKSIKFQSPEDPNPYDRIDLAGNDRIVPLVKAAADNVFYLKTKIETYKDPKSQRTFASTDGKRLLVTEFRPTCYCKNRDDLPFEIEIPKDRPYSALRAAIENAKPKSSEQLISEIHAIMERADAKTKESAAKRVAEAGANVELLKGIKTRLIEKVAVV